MEVLAKVQTVGADGAALGEVESQPITGFVESVQVDHHGTPATTVVAITEVDGMARNILVLAAGNTDGLYYPRVAVHDTTGAPIADAPPARIYLPGTKIKVAVTLSNAINPAVTVRVNISKE